MCEFVSWIEKDRKNYWLRDDEVKAKGWEMINSVGHEAIEKYFGISGGVHKETPEFPPKEVREAINNGEMKEMMKAGGYKEVKFGDNWSKYTKLDGCWGKGEYNEKGNRVKYEDSKGYWYKKEYDKKGNQVKYETSTGYWNKREYDKKGNQVKYEDSSGYWWKREYDEKGNQVKYETSTGYWDKGEYDEKGNQVKFEWDINKREILK